MTSTLKQPRSAVDLEPFMGFITKELLIRYRLRRDGVDKNYTSFFATILYVGKSAPEPFEIIRLKFHETASIRVSFDSPVSMDPSWGNEDRVKMKLQEVLEPWNNEKFPGNHPLLKPRPFVGIRTTHTEHVEVLELGHADFNFFTGVLLGKLAEQLRILKLTQELQRHGRPLEGAFERMLVRFSAFAAQNYTFAK